MPDQDDGTYARQFVYVEDDGSVRELDAGEVAYLNTPFSGADGDRPYIKISFAERTADGRLAGFLRRGQLPPGMLLRPAPDVTE